MALRAGVARIPLEAPLGVPMLGYGARIDVAEAVHDPLHARALYLESESGELLLIEVDLCLLAPPQADAVRQRIAARAGLPAGCILLGCIHTHSGPEPGFAAWLGGAAAPSHAERLFARIEEAGVRATEQAGPARLGIGHTEARIGANRRRSDGPIDPSVWIARVDQADREPLAILYLHGCHPTVLGHENLQYSADWPGVASRVIEERFPGATALFALSAHADVDPRSRGLMDLARDGQSQGASFEVVEALGREVGEAVAEATTRIETRSEAAIRAVSTHVPIPVHGYEAGEAAHREHLAGLRADALAALGLDADCEAGTGELFRLVRERTRGLAPDVARERIARARRYLRDHTAPRFAGSPCPCVEVQLLQLGELWLLGLPAEPTVDVGLDWRRRLGGVPGAVVSIANGWLRYLPHPDNFREPKAHLTYEVLMSTLVPDAATRLLDAGEKLRSRLVA